MGGTQVGQRLHEDGPGVAELGLALDDDLPPAWAEPLRLRHTIRKLISNAIRYGGAIVVISTGQSGDTIQVVVSDNGDGVPSEDEATIFLPYRRSTRGRRDASSIGLGLWVCRQLAHAMGGHLVYQRREGWTEFLLTIPTRPPDEDSTFETAALRAPADLRRPLPPVGRARFSPAPRRSRISWSLEAPVVGCRTQILR